MATVRERFNAKVDIVDGHRLWTGSCDAGGVPQFRVAGRLTTARRAAWELEHGPVPSSKLVSACPADRRCVDVTHLQLNDRPRTFRDVVADAAGSQRTQQPLVPTPNASPPAPVPGVRRRRTKGSGSIELRSPGVWKIVVTGIHGRVARTVDGTREDAEIEALLLAARIPASLRRFGTLVDAYFVLLEREGRAPGTVRRYTNVWDHWLAKRLADVPIEHVNPPLLQSVVDAMATAGQSTGSVNQALSLLSGALAMAVRAGHIDHNPILNVVLPDGRTRSDPRNGNRHGS